MNAGWEFRPAIRPELPRQARICGGRLVFSAPGEGAGSWETGDSVACPPTDNANFPPWMIGSVQLSELWDLAAQIHSGQECTRDLLNKEAPALAMESPISLACRSEEGFRRSVQFLSNAVVVDWLTKPARHRPPAPGLLRALKELGVRPGTAKAMKLLEAPPCCPDFEAEESGDN